MITSKQRAIKLAKLNKAVKEITPLIFGNLDAFRDLNKGAYLVDKDAASGTSCVYVARKAQLLLADRGIDTVLVGGLAAFSVNKGRFGILDYGYSAKANTTSFANTDNPYHGHCWLEIKSLDVIVDLTTHKLKKTFEADSALRGITELDFNITTNPVFNKSESKSFDRLMSGELGRHYQSNREAHEELQWRLKAIPQLDELVECTEE